MNKLKGLQIDDKAFDRIQAIIHSMTLEERRHPELINGSRRRRIAAGSGSDIQAVNQLLNQFKQMQKMMKQTRLGPNAQEPFPDVGHVVLVDSGPHVERPSAIERR